MGGGGKGGGQTSQQKIPQYVDDVARRNLARAEAAQQIDYMPYYGPSVAAFNPNQLQAMQANIGAAEAFGLAQPGALQPLSGMPQAQVFADGSVGYSSAPLYEQALAEAARRDPASYQQREKLFVSDGSTYSPTADMTAPQPTTNSWFEVMQDGTMPSSGSTIQMPMGVDIKV